MEFLQQRHSEVYVVFLELWKCRPTGQWSCGRQRYHHHIIDVYLRHELSDLTPVERASKKDTVREFCRNYFDNEANY